jgi:DnaJ-class molecular chaperone
MPKCPACNATGFESWTDELPCAACAGEGSLLGAACVVCDGRGVLKSDTVFICEVCKGVGEVPDSSHTIKSPRLQP